MDDNLGSEITCTVTIESTNSTINRKIYKNLLVAFGRNEFRELMINLNGPDLRKRFLVNDKTTVHRKFVKEGKASIQFPDQNITILFSNCPPNKLYAFIKTVIVKKSGKEPILNPRQRLVSEKKVGFKEISPLTLAEVNGNGNGNGKTIASPQTPVTSKRKFISGKENCQKRRNVRNAISMTIEQRKVLDLIKNRKNVFFTGSAGTGKSFLLKKIVGILPPESTMVTASTGIAACQIGGVTLHCFAGIGTGQSLKESLELANRKAVAAQWMRCEHLIVDEISMVDGEFFDLMEKVGRAVKKSDLPFGGIQLILCGDFLQLPPVCKGTSKKFCFQVDAWWRCQLDVVELVDIHRQSDPEFIDILQNVREGRCTKEMTEILRSTADHNIEVDDILATRLCTHKKDVASINQEQLLALPGNARVFTSTDNNAAYSSFMDLHCPVPQKITLKTGCQVMLCKNLNVSRGLVNGARGVVTGFDSSGRDYNCPIVRFRCGNKQLITYERWGIKAAGGTILTRHQLPLSLAWAISIHKSQGMTLDCVEMSLGNVFENGQAYVALSRAKSLDGLRIIDFDPKCVKADKNVIEFYRRMIGRKEYC